MRDYLRARRIAEEVLLLALRYGEVDYDEVDGRWIMLPRFPLPPHLGRPDCALLVELLPAYPLVPPLGVYVDRDLPLYDHYFPDVGSLNRYAHKGWAWICLHDSDGKASSWRPGMSATSGDNLLVLLALVHTLLDESA